MSENRMILVGQKESFIVRVLMKKVADAEAHCKFVPCTVNDIHDNLEGISLVALFMEDGEIPNENVMHFLADSMEEKDIKLMVVGNPEEIKHVTGHISADLIYKVYQRPVDNAQFADDISEYFKKFNGGEFKKSILIVDDDPQYLTLVREWLRGSYKVSMANSGLQAIKWLGKNKVDLILLDHEMPVTTGPQVLEMLRSDEDTKDIPVMFLTGKGDKQSVMAVVALKPEGYFLKTIQRDELLEKLMEFFAKRK